MMHKGKPRKPMVHGHARREPTAMPPTPMDGPRQSGRPGEAGTSRRPRSARSGRRRTPEAARSWRPGRPAVCSRRRIDCGRPPCASAHRHFPAVEHVMATAGVRSPQQNAHTAEAEGQRRCAAVARATTSSPAIQQARRLQARRERERREGAHRCPAGQDGRTSLRRRLREDVDKRLELTEHVLACSCSRDYP